MPSRANVLNESVSLIDRFCDSFLREAWPHAQRAVIALGRNVTMATESPTARWRTVYKSKNLKEGQSEGL